MQPFHSYLPRLIWQEIHGKRNPVQDPKSTEAKHWSYANSRGEKILLCLLSQADRWTRAEIAESIIFTVGAWINDYQYFGLLFSRVWKEFYLLYNGMERESNSVTLRIKNLLRKYHVCVYLTVASQEERPARYLLSDSSSHQINQLSMKPIKFIQWPTIV